MTWRPVVGFEGVYEVSDAGDVRRVGASTRGLRVLRPRVTRKGYLRVALHRDGVRVDASPHRLVLDAFVGPMPSMEANHRNGLKADNRLDNLEWATPAANSQHAVTAGLRPSFAGERNPRAKLTAADVAAIRRDPSSGPQLASRYGVSRSLIGAVKRGEVWS